MKVMNTLSHSNSFPVNLFDIFCFYCLLDLSTNLGDYEVGKSLQVTSILSESKHWIVVQLPVAYMATNWPIRVRYRKIQLFFSLNPN